jgi:hypothetical protein
VRTTVILTCLLAALVWPSEVRGQRFGNPEARGWGSVAAGWGQMHCAECEVTAGGVGLGVAWGLAVNRNLFVALSLDAIVGGHHRRTGTACLFPLGCGQTASEGRDMVVALGPIVRFYPLPDRQLFVRAGGGLGLTGLVDPNVLFAFGPQEGLATHFGVGWDVPIGEGRTSITPVVKGLWIRPATPPCFRP